MSETKKTIDIQTGVERALKEAMPEIIRVVAVYAFAIAAGLASL